MSTVGRHLPRWGQGLDFEPLSHIQTLSPKPLEQPALASPSLTKIEIWGTLTVKGNSGVSGLLSQNRGRELNGTD